jgi:hypothetical protein
MQNLAIFPTTTKDLADQAGGVVPYSHRWSRRRPRERRGRSLCGTAAADRSFVRCLLALGSDMELEMGGTIGFTIGR